MPQSATERDWIYNALDCCVTLEVLEETLPQLNNLTAATYAFERALQGPILDMNTRGVLVDDERRWQVVRHYESQIAFLQTNFNTLVLEGVGVPPINWASPAQVGNLLYDVMGLPEVTKRGRRTADRDALEKLGVNYMMAEPLVNHILSMRDLGKKVGVLKTGIDPDGRMRTSYNIAGTRTGRLSSSFSEFGDSGTNFQNVEERLREIFIADHGKKLAYIDLEQAESRAVGALLWNLFGDPKYLDACESGDLHTYVCRLTNPALPWTGVLSTDKELAERPFYRQHSFRHMNKVLGHGSNYGGQPTTMEKHTKIPKDIIRAFQNTYFSAFPGLHMWHEWVEQTLKDDGMLISLTGRRRRFFGRRTEADTIREAIAFDPQGSVADLLNQGMLQVWRSGICELLMQVHDAILIQYPQELEDEIVPMVKKMLKVPLELKHGRTLLIPSDAAVGWNWAKATKENPDGMKKFKGHDDRIRTRNPPTSLLDRRVHSAN